VSGILWGAVVDAVVLTLTDALTVDVWDGEPAAADITGVVVGAVLGSEEGAAGSLAQEYRDLGPAARKTETGAIACYAIATTGDDDLAAMRSAVCDMVGDISDVLRAEVHIGLGAALSVEVTAGTPRQGRTPGGCFALLPFDINYRALL